MTQVESWVKLLFLVPKSEFMTQDTLFPYSDLFFYIFPSHTFIYRYEYNVYTIILSIYKVESC